MGSNRSSSVGRRRHASRSGSGAGRAFLILFGLVVAGIAAILIVSGLASKGIQEITLPLRHEDVIRQQAQEKDVDAALIAAVIYSESQFVDQTSHADARGLMQITPQTAEEIEKLSGGTTFELEDLRDPELNIRYGTFYLAHLLDRYDDSKIPPSKLWPGAVTLNGVNSHAFANIITYRRDKFPNGGPQSWAEFWDTARFPGPRCLQNYAGRVLAFALMADGVERSQLFPYDLDRAFKSLDRLKKDIRVWWSQSPQSQQLIRDGEVDAIGMWNTSAQQLVDQKAPVELVFNQAVIDVAAWVVARGTPRAKNAWRFIEFAVAPERLAKFAEKNNYGPMNPASFKFLPPDVVQRMPTSPENLAKAVVLDAEKLLPQLDTMAKRFEQWLSR